MCESSVPCEMYVQFLAFLDVLSYSVVVWSPLVFDRCGPANLAELCCRPDIYS